MRVFGSTFSSLSDEQYEWVSHTGILTHKLSNLYDDVCMTVLNHAWKSTNWWERYVLELPADEKLLRRDIIMHRSKQICWFARTMIPIKTYELNPDFFNRLNNEPLGQLIFNEPRVSRRQIHSYTMNEGHIEFYWVNKAWRNQASELLTRLSSLQFEGQGMFYLLEVFLPGLEEQ